MITTFLENNGLTEPLSPEEFYALLAFAAASQRYALQEGVYGRGTFPQLVTFSDENSPFGIFATVNVLDGTYLVNPRAAVVIEWRRTSAERAALLEASRALLAIHDDGSDSWGLYDGRTQDAVRDLRAAVGAAGEGQAK